MAQWVMGIDGGGTGCRAVLADGEGRVAGQADGGPANVMSDREGAVASILAVSLAALGGRDPADCVACLGLAGAEVTDANGWLPGRLPFARAVVVQDARTALQGALGDVDGIVAAIGTGSVFMRRYEGEVMVIGGRGPVLGDEASGAWCGKRLLSRTLRAHDGVERRTALTDAVLDRMGGVGGIIAFARTAGGAEFAALARDIAGNADDPAASDVLAEGEAHVSTYIARLQPPDQALPVAFTGGLGPIYATRLGGRWQVRPPLGTPLDGALSLARGLLARPALVEPGGRA